MLALARRVCRTGADGNTVSRDEPAQVAAHVPAFNEAADWAELGSYAVFQYLPRDKTAPERICPGITALRTERTGMYQATVRAYLESGANASRPRCCCTSTGPRCTGAWPG